MKRVVVLGVVVGLFCAGVVAAQTAAEPVHFSKLVAFLPEDVEGFTAARPEGSTTAVQGLKLTEVSRTYHKGKEDADETVSVKIMDGAGNQFFAAAHAAAVQFNHEGTEGYEKGFTLDGFPAIEKYSRESKDGSLTVFVATRYLVEIDVVNLDSTTLQGWWKKLDAKRLAEVR